MLKDLGKGEKKRKEDGEKEGKRKMSALEEIMEMDKRRKKAEQAKERTVQYQSSSGSYIDYSNGTLLSGFKNIVVSVTNKYIYIF